MHPQSTDSGELCPSCFARLPRDARFCTTCGTAIRPEALDPGHPTPHPCPREGTPLVAKSLDGLPVEECPQCLGIWIDQATFRDLCQRKRAEYANNPLPERPPTTPLREPVVYLKCPRCGKLMNRQNYGRRSGVIIDECAAHGIWLDDQELERIARFIAEGGLARARAADAERARAEARAAAFLRQPSGSNTTAEPSPLGLGVFDFLTHLFLDA